MKLKCQKHSENSKVMTFFSDVLCLSRYIQNIQCVFSFEPVIKCVSRKGKKQLLNKYPKVGKRWNNLNHRPQSAFDDRTMFAFLSIFSLGFLLLFIAQ